MTTIGLFDSGMGGLSVLRAVRQSLPQANLVYFGDNGQVPYGPRPLAQVRQFSEAITRFLLVRQAQAVVVACNAASAAALKYLRQTFPATPFVGMEPAVKPAAEQTQTKVVGVLATPATFQGELFASVMERFAQGVTVLREVCPGLVQRIEAGEVDTPETEAQLRVWVEPMLRQGIDVLVLGCTHYPFIIPLLEKICGPQVRVIDPAPAVARQVSRVLNAQGMAPAAGEQGRLVYYTSGDPATFDRVRQQLGLEPAAVRAVRWLENAIVEAAPAAPGAD
jgi:glutamate racemase